MVKSAEAVELALGVCQVHSFLEHGHVESAALHVHQLVDQHVTRGANLARKFQTLAQQPRLAVSAPVGEFGELQVDACDTAQVDGKRVGIVGEFKPILA